MAYTDFDIKLVEWSDVRKKLSQHNAKFVEIVDGLSPEKSLRLYKARYKYGDRILKQGIFQLPTKSNRLIPIDSPDVPERIRTDFSYTGLTNPVIMGLKKQLEMFVHLKPRTVPFLTVRPGHMYGVWRILDRVNANKKVSSIWEMTAGAHSLFMLPKISKSVSHNKLRRKFNFMTEKPVTFNDHWEIFSSLYNSPRFHDRWEAEILLFSGEWFKRLDDPAWKSFQLYLYQTNWQFSEFWRNQPEWNMTFSQIHNALRIKPAQYYVDTVNQLLAIGIGVLPGFSPAMDDSFAPIKRLQEIYMNDYGLDKVPIMMQPAAFNMNEPGSCVYYSLQHPTAIELAIKSSQHSG